MPQAQNPSPEPMPMPLPPSPWLNAAVDAQAAMTGGDAIDPALALELFTTRTLGELSTK
jgi:hypothetical protein